MINNIKDARNVIEIVNQIDGWLLEGDAFVLYSILSTLNKPINFLELGSWKGKSTTAIGLSLPLNSKMACIDTWLGSENEQDTGHIEAKEDGDPIYNQFLDNLNKLKQLRPDIEFSILREDCRNLKGYFKNLTFDIIFIDGNHTFEYVKNDFINLVPFCKDDGLIIGHDFHQGCPGVIKFVVTFLDGKYKLYPEKESCIWTIPKKDVMELPIWEVIENEE